LLPTVVEEIEVENGGGSRPRREERGRENNKAPHV